jgi:hypothetical protein
MFENFWIPACNPFIRGAQRDYLKCSNIFAVHAIPEVLI